MGKKKKKGGYKNEDEIDDDISTDENQDDKEDLLPNCPHVGKAVHISTLKKSLKAAWLRVGICGPCGREKRSLNTKNQSNQPKNQPNQPKNKQPALTVKDLDQAKYIWMCLRCGVQTCGGELLKSQPEAGHTFCHVKTPRSDLHCVYVNVQTWSLYCYECKDDLFIDSYKKLREAVEMVKRTAEVKSVNKPASNSALKKPALGNNASNMIKSPSGTSFNSAEAVKVQKARGLTNLGNTCFFNAVMQCLTQSHPLNHVLDQHCQKGAAFCTPQICSSEYLGILIFH